MYTISSSLSKEEIEVSIGRFHNERHSRQAMKRLNGTGTGFYSIKGGVTNV
jgi:hypothetical protein